MQLHEIRPLNTTGHWVLLTLCLIPSIYLLAQSTVPDRYQAIVIFLRYNVK